MRDDTARNRRVCQSGAFVQVYTIVYIRPRIRTGQVEDLGGALWRLAVLGDRIIFGKSRCQDPEFPKVASARARRVSDAPLLLAAWWTCVQNCTLSDSANSESFSICTRDHQAEPLLSLVQLHKTAG